MELEKTSYITGYSDGTHETTKRLFEWLIDENREPAQTKFSAGNIRNLAKEIEYRLNEAIKNNKAIKGKS